MKTLTLLIFGFLLFPMSLSAQSVDVLLQKVSEALSAGKDDYAVSLFRQAAGAGTEQTEMYYWTNVEKNSAVAPRFVRELAAYYKDKRNYDKAYLFYKEWLQYNPEDVSGLVVCAEMQMMRGETKDALKLYEKVLTLDADNLQANIFWATITICRPNKRRKRWKRIIRKSYLPPECNMPITATDCRTCFPTGMAKPRAICRKFSNFSRPQRQGRRWTRLKNGTGTEITGSIFSIIASYLIPSRG